MQDLKILMESSYKQHPAFRFSQNEWVLESGLVESFDRAALTHRQSAKFLDKAGERVLFVEAISALTEIFEALSRQTDDEFERLFLLELRQEIEFLLNQEREWFAKPANIHGLRVDDSSALDNAINMQADRHFFSVLPRSAVDEIRRISEPMLAKFRANAANGKLKREDLSVNSGPVVRAILDVLNREFRKLRVLDAVSAYAGRSMTATGVSVELSLPQATWWHNTILDLPRSPNTLYAHLDSSVVNPKAIVYLTEVTEQHGPTSCYPGAYDAMNLGVLQQLIGCVIGRVGSSDRSPLYAYYGKQYHQTVNSDKFRQHFMRLPENLRFNSHLGWDVMPDSGMEEQLEKAEYKMIGPAGTFIAFDGARLLHRGGLVQVGERIALQVIFSDLTLIDRVVAKARNLRSRSAR